MPGFHLGAMDVCTAPTNIISLAPQNMAASRGSVPWPMALADVRLYSLATPLTSEQVYAIATDVDGVVTPECLESKCGALAQNPEGTAGARVH